MIFKQFFHAPSHSYSYLIAESSGTDALLIDPVLEDFDRYIRTLSQLNLRLVKTLDTHIHADHITASGALQKATDSLIVMGAHTRAIFVNLRVADGDYIELGGLKLKAIHTPGHTVDSYSFVLEDRVFTGDTLLIRGTGRTDFQGGNPDAQYDSLFNKLLRLPGKTLVYPAHDYKGDTVSTIAEERALNPRLQVGSKAEYVSMMSQLEIARPKFIDIALPANMRCGVDCDPPAGKTHSATTSPPAQDRLLRTARLL